MPSVAFLRTEGYDVWAVAEQAKGIVDQHVLALAVREKRWILTFDRDYGELLFARGLPPPPVVVLLRLMNYRPEEPGRLIAHAIAADADLAGYFVVLERDGLRKRLFPIRT